MNIVWILFYAFLAFSVLVFIHEFGHFIVARWSGIGVEAFSIGFGRPIFKFYYRNVEWKVGWIPFGGYCKMKGQDDFGESVPRQIGASYFENNLLAKLTNTEDKEYIQTLYSINSNKSYYVLKEDLKSYDKSKLSDILISVQYKGEPDEFYQRPGWARLFTVLAGPIFNIILGFILFIVVIFYQGQSITPNAPVVVNPKYKNVLSIQDGDIIQAVENHPVNNWNEVNQLLIQGIHNKVQKLTVLRDGQSQNIDYAFEKEEWVSGRGNPGFELPKFVVVSDVIKELIIGKDRNGQEIKKVGPAFESGIQKGDVILAVDGKPSYNTSTFMYQLERGISEQRQFTVLKANLSFSTNEKGDITGFEDYIYSINGKLIQSPEDIKSLSSQAKIVEVTFMKSKDKDIRFKKSVAIKQIIVKPLLVQENNQLTPSIVAVPVVTMDSSVTSQGIATPKLSVVSVVISASQKIGIAPVDQEYPNVFINSFHKDYTVLEALPIGIEKAWSAMSMTVTQFALLPQLSAETVGKNLGGPVAIFTTMGEAGAKGGLQAYLPLLALISIGLGVFNLLPIPAVDGGHVVLTLFEMIRRKPLSVKVIQRFQIVGFFIIISLAVLFTINDIYNRWLK